MKFSRWVPLEVRFRASYKKCPETKCWNWTKYRNGSGRPVITVRGKQVYAHRYSYESATGDVLEDRLCCHTCDNICCVNPKHLFAGTQVDNMLDMKSKDRANKPHGDTNGRAVLSKADVGYIRSNYRFRHPRFSYKSLAKRFGVGTEQVARIVRGEAWKQTSEDRQ